MGHALLDRGQVERRRGIATSGKTDKLPGGREFRGRLRDFDSTIVERLMLERAERAVPDQRLAARQYRNHMLDGARANIEDHVVRPDLVDRDNAGRRVRGKLR